MRPLAAVVALIALMTPSGAETVLQAGDRIDTSAGRIICSNPDLGIKAFDATTHNIQNTKVSFQFPVWIAPTRAPSGCFVSPLGGLVLVVLRKRDIPLPDGTRSIYLVHTLLDSGLFTNLVLIKYRHDRPA